MATETLSLGERVGESVGEDIGRRYFVVKAPALESIRTIFDDYVVRLPRYHALVDAETVPSDGRLPARKRA